MARKVLGSSISSEEQPIKVTSPLRMPGGKGRMLRELLKLMPPHHIYVEVFGGAAHLLFVKEPVPIEVYNDVDSDLVNFFRVLRDPQKAAELCRLLELTPYSREEYYTAQAMLSKEGLSDVEKAYYYFICVQQSFAGDRSSGWGYVVTKCSRGMAETVTRWRAIVEHLPEFTERLLRVQIEHDDFRKIIPRYDTPETLFYCDPPYVPEIRKTQNLYPHEMSLKDHEELVRLLLECKGMVMLSGYRHPVYEPLERAGWRRYDFDRACHLAARTRRSGLRGPGAASKEEPRTESIWLNPQAERAREEAAGSRLFSEP